MSYIGNEPTSVAFLTDTFSGNGSTTAFTLSAAPATTSSILVAITGVLQDPSTYSVSGTTLTFSPAPPTGTSNISVRFLGIPASGVTTTAYRTVTEFTATSGQTTFNVPSYTPGFIDVYQNGVLLGSADYTATSGLTVVLAIGATVGDLVEVISFQVSSVLNAIPNSPASVSTSNLVNSAVTMAKLDSTAQYTGFKNRLINGAMMIDQRNAGGTVTPSNETVTYITDRFAFIRSGATSPTLRQSTDAPAGFVNSLLFTNTSSGSTPTYAQVYQNIEGNNSEDFGWGTASASTVAVSFWVKSSLTGTFSVAIRNSASNRSYVSTYTISSANTWEYKTVTIPGDTTGTWLTDNGIGINLVFRIGGSGGTSTLNAWTATGDVFASGSTNVMGTANATWQLTGVQLEKGSTATSFDYRPYGTEYQLCLRYFYRNVIYYSGVVGGGGGTVPFGGYSLPVTMRATPTAVWNSGGTIDNGSSGFSITGLNSFPLASPTGGYLAFNIGSNATIGRGCAIYSVDASFSAEL